jgi:hypothetical protein
MTECACGNCQFMDTESEAAATLAKSDSGLCRYNPPLPRPDAGAASWPAVGKKDWCGHFAAKVERFMRAAE